MPLKVGDQSQFSWSLVWTCCYFIELDSFPNFWCAATGRRLYFLRTTSYLLLALCAGFLASGSCFYLFLGYSHVNEAYVNIGIITVLISVSCVQIAFSSYERFDLVSDESCFIFGFLYIYTLKALGSVKYFVFHRMFSPFSSTCSSGAALVFRLFLWPSTISLLNIWNCSSATQFWKRGFEQFLSTVNSGVGSFQAPFSSFGKPAMVNLLCV